MGTHRFPSWLALERYEIHHAPKLPMKFGVVIFGKTSARFYGVGQSIAQAAKDAQKKRDSISQSGSDPS